MVTCVLHHAVITYPFSVRNKVINLETQRARARIISVVPTLRTAPTPGGCEPIFGGLSIFGESFFNPSGEKRPYAHGWAFDTSGPFTATYLARGGGDGTGPVGHSDPIEDILAKPNEIVVRIALAAPNASSPLTQFIAQ
ncbi:hypothetical protein PFICI_00064 [Pestalotiopsis fici W106-1]|uniref:Uncharacterized protein n=1 Tax=Pestalotiopsis fici (strain W106-1 / CGMCC3.15140) TaxID=1229662 RepID=W3XLW8_PESFW|nr:uncharacterized protein PFICI_00064 [Pestalotiopsis fici W106-1]ETS86236.1 hypothetical protein PFICI_00064 [Pestalotiopsis fici W106-1]